MALSDTWYLSVVSTKLSPRGLVASLSIRLTCLNEHFSFTPLFLIHFFHANRLGSFSLNSVHGIYLKMGNLSLFTSIHAKGEISTLLPEGAKGVFLMTFGFAFSQTSAEKK